MKTYIATPSTIQRKWYLVDATDKTLGRLAAEVAKVLRGKNKPTFTPNMDTGDYVIVINAEKVDESKLKDLIESAGKINQSVYTDETVNTLNQAKEEAEETIQGKPNQEEVEDSYLNLVNAIQSLKKK